MNITIMLRINVKKNINTVYRQYKKYGIIISFKIVRIIFISNPPMPCLNILPFIINMRFLRKNIGDFSGQKKISSVIAAYSYFVLFFVFVIDDIFNQSDTNQTLIFF